MLLAGWIYLRGGFWSYRTRCIKSNNRLSKFVYKRYLESLGGYISLLAIFDGPPRFPHKPMGIFIAPGARIGTGAIIFQQVTIGKIDSPEHPRRGAPSIGRDVYIGAGAKIIGRVTIGDGAKIGAGAVVVKDVPAGATAASPAAVVLSAKPPGHDETEVV